MNPGKITLILGGCRSGKSRLAIDLAEKIQGKRRIFLATCVPQDKEMRQRVKRHQQSRSPEWEAVETPIDLAGAIDDYSARADVVVADCLTLWVSNLFMEKNAVPLVDAQTGRLTASLASAQCPVILVSNELGQGIVPENALARQYRDVVGAVNQRVAAAAHRVILTVAGIPLTIKDGMKPS